MICVRVPATSANMGPGFDCLGMALGLYNRIYFQESGTGLRINGCDRMYTGEDNLAYIGYLKTLAKYGIKEPEGLEIEIVGEIPISRGLGSSASLIVAGIMGADRIHGLGLSKEDVLLIANAAISILGAILGLITWVLKLFLVWPFQVLCVVLIVFGIVSAAKGQCKELPIVGKFKILK